MKRWFLMLLALGVLITAQASDKFSSSTKRFLQERTLSMANSSDSITKRNAAKRVSVVNGKEMVSAFIRINGKNLAQLEAEGVIINAVFSDFVTAQIPVDKLENVAAIDDVVEIDVTEEMQCYTDAARELTHVDEALAGTGLSQTYDGTGVVVGVIDTGIDFNHATFQDANGKTRISRVYMPASTDDTYGKIPVIDGYSLKGREFYSDAVSNLTTDTKSQSHGTHTTSTAAGTNVNGYSGMAPNAEIVICALGDTLSEVNIANSVKYISNYAKSVNKPCVISISLGSQIGPHDGTGYLPSAYNETAGEGVIICISSANSANRQMYLHKKFEKTVNEENPEPQCGTILTNSNTSYKYNSTIAAYSRTDDAFGMKFVVINSSDQIVYTSNLITNSTFIMGTKYSDEEAATYYDSEFAKYFSGYILVATGNDSYCNKYNATIQSLLQKGTSSGTYRLGILFYGDKDLEIDAWENGNYTSFTGNTSDIGGYTFIDGTDSCSVGSGATAKNVISIGAYVSKDSWKTLSGNSYTYNYTLYNVAPFSSYGVDMKGDSHPFITAPGSVLVAGFNSYCTTYASSTSSYAVYKKTNSTTSKTNYWGAMQGTSMACPTAAGIVALWLQKNPKLTPDEVKKIMRETAITDDYTEAGGIKFGNGKINALPYLEKEETVIPGDVNMDGLVDVADVTTLVSKILGETPEVFNADAADLDGNGTIDVADVTLLVTKILGN